MSRPFVVLLACLSTAALSSALADPPAPTSPTTAPAADKPSDADVQHFLAEGYKPETRGGHEVYCRKESTIGSRVTEKKVCGTIEELRVKEARAQSDVHQSQGH
jgi:hypothetical protein